MYFSYVGHPSGTGDAEFSSRPFPFSAFVALLVAFLYVRCVGDDLGEFRGSVLVATLFVVVVILVLGSGGAGGADP